MSRLQGRVTITLPPTQVPRYLVRRLQAVDSVPPGMQVVLAVAPGTGRVAAEALAPLAGRLDRVASWRVEGECIETVSAWVTALAKAVYPIPVTGVTE